MSTPFTNHTCWCVHYLKQDGTPASRCEYFSSEDSAQSYVERSRKNGANVRMFPMGQTPEDVKELCEALMQTIRALEDYERATSGVMIPHTRINGREAVERGRAALTEGKPSCR